jgi:hypothetical protein
MTNSSPLRGLIYELRNYCKSDALAGVSVPSPKTFPAKQIARRDG